LDEEVFPCKPESRASKSAQRVSARGAEGCLGLLQPRAVVGVETPRIEPQRPCLEKHLAGLVELAIGD